VRWLAIMTVVASACGSGSGSGATSGPIESTVKESRDRVRVKAVHHKLALADLPVGAWIGLPVSGTIELDADVQIPVVDGVRDYRKATGSIAVRCLDTCRIGDDVTRLKPSTGSPSSDAFVGDGILFGHLDLTGLEAEVSIADGNARLTHWRLASADIDLDVALSLALARSLDESRIDACIRLRPTAALKERDLKLYDLLTIMTPASDADGQHHLQVAGTVDRPRMIGRICGESQ
jgi:hypothetical protein